MTYTGCIKKKFTVGKKSIIKINQSKKFAKTFGGNK